MKQYQVQLIGSKTKILFDTHQEADLFLKVHNKDNNLSVNEIEISDSYYQQRNLVNNSLNKYFETTI